MHHLPFAEASLSHKHRKRVGTAGQSGDNALSEEDSQSAAEEDYLYQQQPPASADRQDEVSSLLCSEDLSPVGGRLSSCSADLMSSCYTPVP